MSVFTNLTMIIRILILILIISIIIINKFSYTKNYVRNTDGNIGLITVN